MKKSIYLFLAVFFCMSLNGCTKHIYYLKPEIRGQLYDAMTKKPISNTVGYIEPFIRAKGYEKIKTDEKGNFTMPAPSDFYYYFKPNMKDISEYSPQIYISFDYYEPEIYDYSNGKVINGVFENPGAKKLEILDVGKIYLKPNPEFRTSDEKN